MTDIDPEKLLSLRSVWLETNKVCFDAFEKAQEAQRASSEAESDFIAYARHGEDGLTQERAMREEGLRYGLQQGAAAMAQNYGQGRAGAVLGGKIRG